MQTGYKKRLSKVLLSHPRMFYDASNAPLVMPETPEQGFFPKKKEGVNGGMKWAGLDHSYFLGKLGVVSIKHQILGSLGWNGDEKEIRLY